VNTVRRYPITVALILLVLFSAINPLPSLVDAATGAPVADADLARPLEYIVVAPFSDVLDALTFLSLQRACALLAVWAVALAVWGALRSGTRVRRITRAVAGPLLLLAVVAATVVLPRPVPRLVTADSGMTVIDYHAHTEASHDGRHGWSPRDLAAWHAAQGFEAAYVTDHNRVFDGVVEDSFTLLPGAEWSVYHQHILALGEVSPIDRDLYNRDAASMLGVFAEVHRRGGLAMGSLPEYWRNSWETLDYFVKAGVDGFEIVNCAPKAIGFPNQARARVVSLARQHNLLLIGGSDNHGWGKVTCVWNLASPSAHGYAANRVLARSLALLQGEWKPWTAAYSQPWLMFRSLTWPERASWLTWMLVFLIYRAVPRRDGDARGIGILARSLKLRALLRRPKSVGP